MTPDTRPTVEELFHRIAAAPHDRRGAVLEEVDPGAPDRGR